MRIIFPKIVISITSSAFAHQGNWIARIHRPDGNNIPLTFEWKIENRKSV